MFFATRAAAGEIIAEAMTPGTVNIFGYAVDAGIVAAVLVSAILVLIALVIRIFCIPRFKEIPKGFQCFLEKAVEFFDNMAGENSREAKGICPYIFAAGLYICFGTLVELVGLRPVFADLNACIAMALCTFFLINFYGVKKFGVRGRLATNFRKSGFAGAFQIISDLIFPFSLTIRLYASILSGYLIMELVYSIVFLSFGVPVVLSVIFTIFHALIQAYVFTLLTTLFVGEAME